MRQHSRFHAVAMLSMLACSISAAGTATSENPAGVSAPRQPVEYIVKEKSLVGNEMYEAGTRAMYAGLPAENLEPTCDIGRARYQEYLESNTDRVAKMISNNKESGENGIGNPGAFMAALNKQREDDRKELAEQLAAQSINQAEAIGTAVAQAMSVAFAAFFPNGFPTAAPAAPVSAPAPAVTEDTASTKEEIGAKEETGGTAKRK